MARSRHSTYQASEKQHAKTFRKFVRILQQVGGRPSLRLIGFGLGCSGWFVLILLFLWKYQVLQVRRFAEQAKKQQQGAIEVRAARGIIYDRFGEKLAFSVPVDSIGVFPRQVPNPELTAALLSEVLHTDERTLYQKLTRDRFQWVKRLAEPGEAERVRNLNPSGIHFEKESRRYYPHGAVASHLLGAVGVDHTGQAGLEQHFEKLLRGQPGKRLLQYDGRRSDYAGRAIKEPVPGADLVLTIDHRIQMTAESELARAIQETQATSGTVVIMDPHNGDLLAVANWPTFNPNERVRKARDLELRKNFAFSTLIEPGSSFKIVPFAAAIEEKLTTPDEILDCQMGAIYIGSRRIRDHKPLGLLTVSEVLAHSSNVGAIKLGLRLEPTRLYEYARAFGFGQNTGLPLPGETAGLLRPVERWNGDSIGSIPMGHEVGVSAIQLARAASVIANGGMLVQPVLVQSILNPDGAGHEPKREEPKRVLSAKTAAVMRAMMEGVVQAGTGRRAQTPGYRVAGKTGTPEKVDPETGAYSRQHVPNFVGFAPLNDPSIVVVIVLDSPVGEYYGGAVAAPVFPRVATQALRFRNVPPDLPIAPEPQPTLQAADQPAADVSEGTSLRDEELGGEIERQADGSVLVAAMTPAQPGRSYPTAENPAADWSEEGEDMPPAAEPVAVRVAGRLAPDFRGKTVREVVAESATLGLEVDLRGSGFAHRQRPRAGMPVLGGQRIAVEFASSPGALEGAP